MNAKSKSYAFDFDGVIAEYDGFKGHEHTGEPIRASVEAIRTLKVQGHKILIYSTRSSQSLQRYCETHQIPVDYYNENPEVDSANKGKPAANIYIDDRALRFNGQTTGELLREIEEFEVYWKKSTDK